MGKLLLGNLVTGEVSVGEVVTAWGNCVGEVAGEMT